MIAARLDCPIGTIVLTEKDGRITSLRLAARGEAPRPQKEGASDIGREAGAQLAA